jgi:archaellum component FlaF (FlaF/FlaG flagellin family)
LTSSVQSAAVHNSGNAPLSISNIAISGANPGDFNQTNNCSGTVAQGSECGVSVTFTPSALGARTASLVITDNASDSPQSIMLTGIGIAAPIASLSTTSLSFPAVSLGSASATQNVTLTNTGTATLNLGQVGATAGDYVDFNNIRDNCFNAVLAPGASCAVSIEFVPEATGLRTATYLFNDNAYNNPQTVALSGTGIQPATPPATYSTTVLAQTASTVHQIQVSVTVQ